MGPNQLICWGEGCWWLNIFCLSALRMYFLLQLSIAWEIDMGSRYTASRWLLFQETNPKHSCIWQQRNWLNSEWKFWWWSIDYCSRIYRKGYAVCKNFLQTTRWIKVMGFFERYYNNKNNRDWTIDQMFLNCTIQLTQLSSLLPSCKETATKYLTQKLTQELLMEKLSPAYAKWWRKKTWSKIPLHPVGHWLILQDSLVKHILHVKWDSWFLGWVFFWHLHSGGQIVW